MKLNLGCGDRILPQEEGWTNVDFNSKKADVHCDIRKLPFDDDSVDYIAAYHVIEHFTQEELIYTVIPEWKRVMKKFAVLDLEFPNIIKITDLYKSFEETYDSKSFHDSLINLVMGNHNVMGAGHMWAWTENSMKIFLEMNGFFIKEICEPAPLPQFPNGAEKVFTKIIAIKRGE